MLRMLKWVLFGLVVAVIAGVVTVELISWNFLKPRIAAQVEATTGRELSIDGDVEIDLLPRPRITLHEVSLANPDWAETPDFVELDRLRLAPDLLALATGRLALARIDVDAPVVRLIDRSDGTANWVLDGAGEGDAGPVPVRRLDITDAEISYRSPKVERTLALDLPSIRLRDDGESANTRVMVGFQGREIEIEADTDSFFSWDSPGESFDGRLQIVADESRIDSEFSLPKSSFPEAWQVRLEATIEDIDRWMERIPGARPTGIGRLAFEARLGRDGTTWNAEEIEIATMQASLQADLEADTGGDVPALSGSIRVDAINVAALRELRPAADEPATKSNGFALPPLPPVLPRLAGSVDVTVEQIAGLSLPAADSSISNASARVRFDTHLLAVEDLVASAAGGTVRGAARLTSGPDQVAARATLSIDELQLGVGDSADSNDDGTDKGASAITIDGDVEIDVAPVPRDNWDRATLASNLDVKSAKLDYADPAGNTRLSASAMLAGGDARPVVGLSGTLAGRPLEAEIEGDPLVAAGEGSAYGLEGRATSAGLALLVDTTLDSMLNPAHLQGRLTLSGDSVDDLEPWLGVDLIETPAFRINGRLDRDGAQWKAEELAVELGDSRLRGEVRFDAGERPRVVATLDAAPLDLAWMQSASGSGAEPADTGGSTEKRASDLDWLRAFDASLELDASELILPDAPRLVGLEMLIVLEAGEVDIERFGAGVADGSFSVEGRLDAAEIPASGRLDARFDDITLQRLGDTFTPLEDRLGRLSGSVSLEAEQTLEKDFREDIVAPMLGRIRIESSEFRFTDSEAGTDMKFSAKTEGLADGKQRFRLDGEGRYDGEPAWLRYRSDALLDVRVPDRPYAVDLDISVVQSRIELDGTLMRPLALEGLDLELALSGPNPQRLTRLLGVPLPDLPSYRVAGRLELDEERWSLSDLDGTVGESDLRGRLALDVAPSPPLLTGDLRSDSLDIDDLAGIAGVESANEAEQDRFVLPDDPLVGDAWREVTADVRYRGESVRAAGVPLTDLVIEFRLSDGHARFEPVGFGVGDGSIDFILDLDARPQPAEGTLSVEVRGVDLSDALRDWNLADDSAGVIGAQGKFWVTGESIAELLGSADGGLLMLMAEGRLDALLVELAGLDASQAFLAWLGDREAIPINCAYVDLKARSGLVDIDTFVIDSVDTIFTAGGQVDLDDERLDVSVVAHPQDASVLIGRTPFHFGGTFDDIEAGLHGGELATRLAAGAGLAALAAPLAALVPLLEAGGNDRTGYCQGLVGRTMEALDSDGGGP